MKTIAVTVTGGRRDFFWLGGDSVMTSSPVRGLGFNLRLGGGPFNSVPAATSSMARREPVVFGGDFEANTAGAAAVGGSGCEAGAMAATADAGGGSESEAIALNLGPFGGQTILDLLTHRLDLFGVGEDYSMYHKVIWGTLDRDDLSPWFHLGGIFTSAPAAIAWAGDRVDVFGVGMDHALYTKNRVGERWTPDWQRLAGAFTSAASLVSRGPKQLEVFVRGADYTLRRNWTDGTNWFGWQNHGGSLASQPAAVSWGPDRVDVFAIFKDGALWHRWWDGELWNEWESLGGNYVGEPAVASWGPGRLDVFVRGAVNGGCHHLWFADGGWSAAETLNFGTTQGLAEAPTVVSAAPNHLDVFIPVVDHQIREGRWDGQAWQFGAAGAQLRIPQRYRFSIDFVKVHTTRAFNADTDAAAASLAVGNMAPITKTQWIGEIGGLSSPKESQTNLLDFDATVDLAEPMSFSYIVVNNGHAEQTQILDALSKAGDSLSLAGSSSMQEDIAKGVAKFVSVKIVGLLSLGIPVIGSVLAAIEIWLLGKLTDAIFRSCDGIVAVEMQAMMGRDLWLLTHNGTKTFKVKTRHPGTDSPTACGANSDYEVRWSIKPLP